MRMRKYYPMEIWEFEKGKYKEIDKNAKLDKKKYSEYKFIYLRRRGTCPVAPP